MTRRISEYASLLAIFSPLTLLVVVWSVQKKNLIDGDLKRHLFVYSVAALVIGLTNLYLGNTSKLFHALTGFTFLLCLFSVVSLLSISANKLKEVSSNNLHKTKNVAHVLNILLVCCLVLGSVSYFMQASA